MTHRLMALSFNGCPVGEWRAGTGAWARGVGWGAAGVRDGEAGQ